METVAELLKEIEATEAKLCSLRQRLAEVEKNNPYSRSAQLESELRNVILHIEAGNMHDAVRILRSVSGYGLKEAVDFIRYKSVAQLKEDIKKTFGVTIP